MAAATVALVTLGAQAAEAHVRVHADSTESGSFSALSFRVPNESDTAGTVKLVVTLPSDNPFLFVSTKAVPGWQASVEEAPLPAPITVEGTTVTKAARTVTWQAQGNAAIAPGQYEEFSISVGPLPKPGTVLLPAQQYYSDGTVVAWDQPTPASGAEPEHPAPELVVTAAAPAAGATGTASAAAGGVSGTASPAPAAPVAAAPATESTSSADWLARTFATVALAVSLVAAGFGLAAVTRQRRGSP